MTDRKLACFSCFAVLGVLLVASAYGEEGHCIWYGQCFKPPSGKAQNCNYTGPAKPLTNKTAIEIFKDLCPDLAGRNICCDAEQIMTLKTNMGIPQRLISRCPSCYRNFKNLYCELTCAPDMSNFLEVTSYNIIQPDAINGINYYITDDFTTGMFNSCKDVVLPANNEKALNTLCGTDHCNPHYWLKFMGSTKLNPATPFDINFIFNNSAQVGRFKPMNVSVIPCSVPADNQSYACSCQDCAESCGIQPPPIVPSPPWEILGIDAMVFIMSCVFGTLFLAFTIQQICYVIIVKNAFGIGQSDSEMTYAGDTVNSVLGRPSQFRLVNKSEVSCFERMGRSSELSLERLFCKWGRACAGKYRYLVIIATFLIVAALGCGIILFKVTTDPVLLWSAKNSEARTQKSYFDNHFGPFYRTEQVILTPKNQTKWYRENLLDSGGVWLSPVYKKEVLYQVLDLQNEIVGLETYDEETNETITLNDICFKPLAPDVNECTIQSVLNYFQNNRTMLDKEHWDPYHVQKEADYIDHFRYCMRAPTAIFDTTLMHTSCLGTFGGPVMPWVALGGFDGENYENATTFVITLVVNNHLNADENKKAMVWEKAYIEFMKNYTNDNFSISYTSERSIEDELDRESNSDVMTILVSYLIMFAYISITLGQYPWSARLPVWSARLPIDSKMSLGLAGVLIVLMSVTGSLGVYSYFQVPATLIIIEVVPFLVLAVGVDNIFILVQAYQRDEPQSGEEVEDQIGRVVGKVGPSMLLTSLSESVAFFLGALITMPAVRVFSLYAALAVLFDFILQISCFVSIMSLDARRQKAARFDMCCCIQGRKDSHNKTGQEGLLYKAVKYYYAPGLMSGWIRPIVMVVFMGWLCFCVAMVNKLDIGLDQRLSMPKDSYVLRWFNDVDQYLSVGAPVYFVVKDGYDYVPIENQNLICGAMGCDEQSLVGQIFKASQQANGTRIAHPTSSWVDDYFDWLKPGGNPPCCRVYKNTGDFCASTVTNDSCVPCNTKLSHNRPVDAQTFNNFLPMFLKDNPGEKCAKGGHAAYGQAVDRHKNGSVGATYFMTYHTIMKTSHDYIEALKYAREIATNITRVLNNGTDSNFEVFPYSVFYVFYEQYLYIVYDTWFNLVLCIAAIFVVTFILLGFDLHTALMVIITISMIVGNMFGLMYLWDISLNALSLVNLIMCVGISVEFCSHIARAFATSVKGDRVERAQDALAHMGSSVLSGITLTKLGGIIVLGFSKSQLFQVFYFRMYLGIVLFGATHGLIFLPVMLSYIGPSVNKATLLHYQQQKSGKSTAIDRENLIGGDGPGVHV